MLHMVNKKQECVWVWRFFKGKAMGNIKLSDINSLQNLFNIKHYSMV